MIDRYTNQTVSYKGTSTQDEYCQTAYVTTVNMLCRYEYDRKIVKNKEGKEVISEARCFTKTAVKPDDVITFDSKDWPIISVKNEVDLNGTVKFYEARL